MATTEIRLLGPIEVSLDGRPLKLGTPKQRAVLAMLALRPNAVVASDELIAGLWGETPPPSAVKLVQLNVSQLRKLLAGGDAEIVTHGRGYELRLPADAVDVGRFERLTRDGPEGARKALELWRGTPLVDVLGEPFAAAEVRRLEELALGAREQALEAEIAAGNYHVALAGLDELIEAHPLRERLHALRMRALYASGRQADALEAYRSARRRLVEDVGVEPGPELRALHDAVLQQDPELAARPRAGDPPPQPHVTEAPADRRRSALLIAAALAALLGVAAFAVLRLTDADRLDGIGERSVGRIDADGSGVVANYELGGAPRALAAGAGAVWVANSEHGTVSRIEDDRIVTIPVGADPAALGFGAGSLWVVEREAGTLSRIEPASNKVIGQVAIGNRPSSVAVGFGSVWVGSAVDQTISQVAVGENTARRRLRLEVSPSAITTGHGSIWAASEESGALLRIDPRSGDVIRALRVGNRPVAVAASPSAVWVVNRQDGTVWRIDPASDSVTDTIRVGRDPAAIVARDGDVWVAGGDARVTRIDDRLGTIERSVAIANPAAALTIEGGSVWAAVETAPSRHRGGTLRVGGTTLGYPTLGPVNYDAETWGILALAYDGLVAYKRAGGSTYGPLVGDLATEVPQPSAGGRRYVFRLRAGIRYSDGSPVRASDVRASFEDLVRSVPEGLPSIFAAIEGAADCTPERCDMSRGVVIDDRARTVTLRLREPDPDLLHKLATPFGMVAPARHPFSAAKSAPGTGPYRIEDYGAESGVTLTRNPHFRVWSRDARPAGVPDQIQFVVSDPQSGIADVNRGWFDVMPLADVFAPLVAPTTITELGGRHPERLRTHASPSLDFMWLNVREAPFDDVRVRQALNHAVDRGVLAGLEGGDLLARPLCQLVPPGHPGYSPACPFDSAPDLARARRLVGASATAGTRVTVHVSADRRRMGRYFRELLERLGYRSRLEVRKEFGEYYTYVSDPRNRAQMGISGFAADYAAPSTFTLPFLCASNVPGASGNPNLSRYCDSGFERRVRRAERLRGRAGDAAWQEVYEYLQEQAPAVPLVTKRSATFIAPRVGNYQHHPLFGVLYDQLTVR